MGRIISVNGKAMNQMHKTMKGVKNVTMGTKMVGQLGKTIAKRAVTKKSVTDYF